MHLIEIKSDVSISYLITQTRNSSESEMSNYFFYFIITEMTQRFEIRPFYFFLRS